MIEIDRDAVRGELPDVVFDAVEWERLAWLTAQAIDRQDAEVRDDIKANFADLSFEVTPFDESWSTEIRVNGLPLLRLHVSDLFKFVPLSEIPKPEDLRKRGIIDGGYL